LLGYAFGGIYHIDKQVIRADFQSNHHVSVCIGSSLATFDDDILTRLVFLAHQMHIRFAVKGAAPGYIRMEFWPRQSREGRMFERHPTLDEAVAQFKKYFGEVE